MSRQPDGTQKAGDRGNGRRRREPGARGRWRRLLWLFPIALASALLFAWLTWISPYGYEAPADLAAIDADSEHRVFVYGTLRQPLVRRLVTGKWIETREATLPGFAQQGLDLERRPDAVTEGEVFTVAAPTLARLDRYERLGIRYERMLATLADHEQAWVYRRLDVE